VDRILRLIRHHDRHILPEPKAVAKAVHAVGEDLFEDLLKVKHADKSAQNPVYISEGLEYVQRIRGLYSELLEKEHCFGLKDLAINGQDLIGMGFVQGREIGLVLDMLLQRVLVEPSLNRREILLRIAEEYLATAPDFNTRIYDLLTMFFTEW